MITFSEVIRVKDGVLDNLQYHQDRVNSTANKFYGKNIDLISLVDSVPKEAFKGLYKCRITYTDKIESINFTQYQKRIIKTARVVVDNGIEYSYKSIDRDELNSLLEKSGCDEIIIIKNGMITDASAYNIVIRKGEKLYTPDSYLLRGTQRQALIDNRVLEEKHLCMEDLRMCDEVMFINAMNDLSDCQRVSLDNIMF